MMHVNVALLARQARIILEVKAGLHGSYEHRFTEADWSDMSDDPLNVFH
jgi:hypothetical protein